MMLVDAHVHYNNYRTAGDFERLAAQEPYLGQMLRPARIEQAASGAASPERLLADMDRAGIDRVVLMDFYAQQHATCVSRNDELMALARRWPDRIIPFAMIQPRAGTAALDELKRCVDGGMAGVGELLPYAQGGRLDDADFLRLAEACIEHDIPLTLHVSEPVGHLYLGKSPTPLQDYLRLAVTYPELKLILAHWGGGLLFYEIMPEVRRQLANVYYDTAASPLLYPTPAIFDLALRSVDPRKLMYGSDYPLAICRRAQREPDFCPFLAEISALDLPADVRADIMGSNLLRLLGQTGPEMHATGNGPARTLTAVRPGMSAKAQSGVPGAVQIKRSTPVRLIAEAWPATRATFEKYGIPWEDSPVPYWEPVAQAAAARGWRIDDVRRLLDELNAIASCRDAT